MRLIILLAGGAIALTGCASTPSASSTTETAAYASDAEGVTLVVKGMSCPLCATNVDKQLLALPGVMSADVDLSTGEIAVGFRPFGTPPSESQLRQAIVDSGYTLESIRER